MVYMIYFLTFRRPVADWAKSSGANQFLFISSAGIYKSTDEPPHVEGVCCIFTKTNNYIFIGQMFCSTKLIILYYRMLLKKQVILGWRNTCQRFSVTGHHFVLST